MSKGIRNTTIYGILTMMLASMPLVSCTSSDEPKENQGNKEYTPIVMDAAQTRTAGQGNMFAAEVFGRMASVEQEKNVLASPLSLTVVLDMLANGVDQESQKELLDVMGVSSLQELNSCYSLLADRLPKADAKVQFTSANSLWLDNSVTPGDEYGKTVKSLFGAETYTTDINSENAVSMINKWCSDRTKGMIPEFMEESPGCRVALINAVYFKGEWMEKFDKGLTKNKPFFNSDGTIASVPTMSKEEHVPYLEADGFSTVAMPYGNGAFSMVVVLPKEKEGLQGLIEDMDGTMARMGSRWATTNVNIFMPKFEIDSEIDAIAEVLRGMGVKRMFDIDLPDYSAIGTPDVRFPFLFQKAVVKIDEEGTEAAAATGNKDLIAPPADKSFRVDHPFMFFIVEKSTKTIVFAGAVRNL